MKKALKRIGLSVARTLGTEFRDIATGQHLGRGFVFPWRGKIHLVGLDSVVRPVFLPQKRVTYWKQEIGFSKHPTPDFPSLHRGGEADQKTGTSAVSMPQRRDSIPPETR
jgi:hypothetical protein